MDRTVTFWLIAGFFFVLWYGVGALLMLIADQPHRAAVRSFFLGARAGDGLPVWGRFLMAGVFGMTSAALVLMAAPALCALLC